jgi:hypothetical protein
MEPQSSSPYPGHYTACAAPGDNFLILLKCLLQTHPHIKQILSL